VLDWLFRPNVRKLLEGGRFDQIKELASKDEKVVNELIKALRDSNSLVCDWAARALGEIGDARAVEPLIEALRRDRGDWQDSEWFLRLEAAEALGKIGNARGIEFFIAALRDSNHFVRRGAAEALGEIGDARAIEPLTAALRDSDWFVRQGAAEALGKIGDERALPELERVAREDKDSLFGAAEVARKAMELIRDRMK